MDAQTKIRDEQVAGYKWALENDCTIAQTTIDDKSLYAIWWKMIMDNPRPASYWVKRLTVHELFEGWKQGVRDATSPGDEQPRPGAAD